MNIPATENFDFTVTVNDKKVTIDGSVVMAEFALLGAQEPSNAQIMEVMRRCVRPLELLGNLSDAEVFAIYIRVGMRLQQLGKPLAP